MLLIGSDSSYSSNFSFQRQRIVQHFSIFIELCWIRLLCRGNVDTMEISFKELKFFIHVQTKTELNVSEIRENSFIQSSSHFRWCCWKFFQSQLKLFKLLNHSIILHFSVNFVEMFCWNVLDRYSHHFSSFSPHFWISEVQWSWLNIIFLELRYIPNSFELIKIKS